MQPTDIDDLNALEHEGHSDEDDSDDDVPDVKARDLSWEPDSDGSDSEQEDPTFYTPTPSELDGRNDEQDNEGISSVRAPAPRGLSSGLNGAYWA